MDAYGDFAPDRRRAQERLAVTLAAVRITLLLDVPVKNAPGWIFRVLRVIDARKSHVTKHGQNAGRIWSPPVRRIIG